MPTFTINKKGGYETTEVDSYINSMEQQLNQYKDKEAAINKAIISAQMASDKMIRQANEETAAVVKKANEESASLLKKAKEEADEILKKANEEKAKIMAEANKLSVALAENSNKQIKDIKATIAQHKEIINNFNKDYAAMVEKYLKSYNADSILSVTKGLDEIDNTLSQWEKSGVPEVAQKQQAVQPNVQTHRVPNFGGMGLNTPKPAAAPEPKEEAPKPEINASSPLAASSVPKTDEDIPKPAETQPKPFIKTGLAGGAGLGGIPANPSYGLGGERTLKNSVSHSEAPKSAEPVPEPVSTVNINVPKFGESSNEAAKPAQQEAPKPGIYKVTADNHLFNENNKKPIQSNDSSVGGTDEKSPAEAKPVMGNTTAKPGIYKVTNDNKLYNDNTDK